MFNLTYMLMVFAFLLIAIVFLIVGLVLRSKIIKEISAVINGQSDDSSKDAFNIIERTKKLLWYFGITYVAIALAVFLEGAFEMLDQAVFNTLFVICGVVLFLFGIFFTAYGIIAMYNTDEKKFGTLRKANLITICTLKDGKKLLVLAPSNMFGAEALNGAEIVNDDKISVFRQSNGRALDFCVVDDASSYKIGAQYLIYSSVLRIKYKGITVAFATNNAFDACVSDIEVKNAEQKTVKNVEAVKSEKTEAVEPVKAKKAAKKVSAKKEAKPKTEKPKKTEAKTKKAEPKEKKAETKAKKTAPKAETKKPVKKAKTEKVVSKKAEPKKEKPASAAPKPAAKKTTKKAAK